MIHLRYSLRVSRKIKLEKFKKRFEAGVNVNNKIESQSITVLVPAFKSRYLSRLLDSLCLQSDKDFMVVICDDASSEPIYEVSSRYYDRLKIK